MNIEDYLAQYADIPFSESPFNEADSLVLCEFIYTDLRGLVPPGGSIGLRELRNKYFRNHSKEELKKQTTYFARAPLMMDIMVPGARFGGMKVCNYVSILDDSAEVQMTAMTFMLGDGTAYVCYSGTDRSISGWKEDFKFSYMKETEGQKLATKYLTDAAGLTDRPLRVGGHSKGGNFAVYASSFAGSSIQDRITKVYTFDGPGFRDEITETENYRRIVPKVVSMVPEESVIGQLLRHDFPDIVVKSSAAGILQHDGFSWCISDARFVRSKLSDDAGVFKAAQKDWLAKMDDRAREAFVTMLFAPLEATQMVTFDEIIEKRLEAAEKALRSLSGMTADERRAMRRFVQDLIASCGMKALEKKLSMINERLSRD